MPNQILTEEELSAVFKKLGAMLNANQIDFEEYEMFDNMRLSHVFLNNRNRMLVLENDVLCNGKFTDAQELDFRVFLAQLPETFRQTAINAISIFGIVIEGVNDYE